MIRIGDIELDCAHPQEQKDCTLADVGRGLVHKLEDFAGLCAEHVGRVLREDEATEEDADDSGERDPLSDQVGQHWGDDHDGDLGSLQLFVALLGKRGLKTLQKVAGGEGDRTADGEGPHEDQHEEGPRHEDVDDRGSCRTAH